MFSGFDNLAEGFKRFSLDALQQQEDEGDKPEMKENDSKELSMLAPVPEQPAEAPPPTKQPNEEDSEWDWDQGSSTRSSKKPLRARKGAPQQQQQQHVDPTKPEQELDTRNNVTMLAENLPVALTPIQGDTNSHNANASEENRALDLREPDREAADKVAEEVAGEPREPLGQSAPLSSPDTETGNSALWQSPSDEMKNPRPAGYGRDTCGETCISTVEDDDERNTVAADATTSPQGARQCDDAAVGENDCALAGDEGAVLKTNNDVGSAAEATDANEARRSPDVRGCEDPNGHVESDNQGLGVSTDGGETGDETPVGRAGDTENTAAGEQDLEVARRELALLKGKASELGGALEESQSEAQQLREVLIAERETARQQAGQLASLREEVDATRMGFEESNAAHQRTAERSHAFEHELRNTRRTVDTLREEAATLRGQMSVAVEDRQEMEAQLRQLHAGLTEGQEAARQEGRREVERLEARLKELLKDRDRRQAELELQNARRKETREMARDLESQLAAVERIAQEREVELNKLKEEIAASRKNTGEATEERKTWTIKYEALERNFKQVRAQSKRAESELEDLRQKAARIEAEKAVLAERVEVEGAERVTVVASITHERDFLMRQVDRLEQELADLRRSQEAQASLAAKRAQTTGALEEYRTRAQQALKAANEVTSQTVWENKRLESEIAKLSAEVARQRPLWEQSKQLEELHHAEVAELKEQLASGATDREDMAAAMASLETRLLEAEEEKRNTHASVMRLEAQGKSSKQELQRQQKALAAAQEREAALKMRLADKDSALRTAADLRYEGSVREGPKVDPDVEKYPPSPMSEGLTPMGWEEEKYTPEMGMGSEAAEAAWKERRRSLVGSFNSAVSEGESVDVQQGSVGEQLFYVHQLRERMSKQQVEMRSIMSELDASRKAADAQAATQAHLEKRLEAALLAKKRLQDLDTGRNAAINLEYLKNCVVGCLRTSEPSEHARLLPVITAILKLSREEADVIAKNISARAQHQGSFGGSLPPPVAGDDSGGGAGSGRAWWSGKS